MQNRCPRTERKSGYNPWLKIHPALRWMEPARVCSPAVGTSVLRFCSHQPWAATCFAKAPAASLPQSPCRCLPSGAAQLIFVVWWAEGVQERARELQERPAQREAWSLLFSFLQQKTVAPWPSYLRSGSLLTQGILWFYEELGQWVQMVLFPILFLSVTSAAVLFISQR